MPIGNFYLSPATSSGTRDPNNDITLSPNPTYPSYGDRIILTTHETEGKLIAQRSTSNPKEKLWVWAGYDPNVPRYSAQYDVLFRHQQHVREDSFGESPYVYLKEDVTDMFGIYSSGTGQIEPSWIRCRIINVDRTIRKTGGYVRYPETIMTFTVDDPTITVV